MPRATSTTRPAEQATITPRRWRWYHAVAFYAVVQGLTFGLSGLVSIARGVVAIFRLKDSKVALSLATRFVWLIVALTAGTFQALWNKDDFYQVGPFVKPRAGLVKKEA